MTEPLREPLEEGQLVTVARFRSAAEAGYFADQLEAVESIHATLTSVDDFNAIAGHWGEVFHLRVAAEDAKQAAAALRSLLSDSSDETDDVPQSSQSEDRFEEPRRFADSHDVSPNWLPIVLAFAAGSASLFAVQALERAAAAPPEQSPATAPLLKKLADSRRPWVQTLPSGGRRELRAETTKEFVLREDRDADGRFERSRSFVTADGL